MRPTDNEKFTFWKIEFHILTEQILEVSKSK